MAETQLQQRIANREGRNQEKKQSCRGREHFELLAGVSVMPALTWWPGLGFLSRLLVTQRASRGRKEL